MTMAEKLTILMDEKGLNKKQFSEQSRIPYMTIVNFYEKGTDNVKLSTLKKIAKYFDVSLDYIANDAVENRSQYVVDLKKAAPEEIESDIDLIRSELEAEFGPVSDKKMGLIIKLAQAILESDI